MSAWALTAASYFICQIHVAKVTFAFVVALFTKPLMISIVDDEVTKLGGWWWRWQWCMLCSKSLHDRLIGSTLLHLVALVTSMGRELRKRMRKLTAIAFSYWLSLGHSVACCCLSGQQLSGCQFRALCCPFSTLQALLYQRRVANLLTGTQNVIKCFADCALLSHNNNNNKCVYCIIKCNWQAAVLRNTLQKSKIE